MFSRVCGVLECYVMSYEVRIIDSCNNKCYELSFKFLDW